jgi:hypothetical protein
MPGAVSFSPNVTTASIAFWSTLPPHMVRMRRYMRLHTCKGTRHTVSAALPKLLWILYLRDYPAARMLSAVSSEGRSDVSERHSFSQCL